MEKNLLHINCSLVLLIKLLGTREYNRFINLMYRLRDVTKKIRTDVAPAQPGSPDTLNLRVSVPPVSVPPDWYLFCIDP